VTLPALVTDLPPVSQQLVMGMRIDDQGMGALKSAGLQEMNISGRTDPAVVERVTKLIVEGPALSLEDQLLANDINGKSFEMGIVPIHADINQDLRWLISEGDDKMYHPVHIHGCQFRIIALDGKPPPEHMAGWKDIAPVLEGGSCEIQVRFKHPATKELPFMAHCHDLEHEDSGMMTDFTVS
jgi:blue copper oxidase